MVLSLQVIEKYDFMELQYTTNKK